jgi:C4-dicarboxylate-specific signal transduction histidine kinase
MSETFETSKDVTWLKDLYFSDPNKQVILQKGETLITEGHYNDRLFLILQGTLKGFLKDENNDQYEVLRSSKNMFVGVYSFFSVDHTTYLTLVAEEETTLAFIDQTEKTKSEETFAAHFLPVIVHEIYLRQLLAQRLTQQRQAAIKKLYEKEKMATLGHLAAGLAHELNNAVGVLAKNTEWLTRTMSGFLNNKKLKDLFENTFKEGQSLNTISLREKRKQLEKKFDLPPAVAKQLAKTSLNEKQIDGLLKENKKELETISLVTEAGIVLHDMDVAATHATHVVQSVRELGFNVSEKLIETSVYETLTKSLALTKPLLQNITINLIKDTEGIIQANPGDLVQVWVNLIKNASESLKNAATIDPVLSIQIKEAEKMVMVIVQDNGPGIEEEMIPKIFQPNFTTKINGLSFGLGVGLSIVKKIINNYKGSISVESQPGDTRFIVQIPKP